MERNREDEIALMNRLFERLHQADLKALGSINISIYKSGSQHVDRVENQYISLTPRSAERNIKGKENGTDGNKVNFDNLEERLRQCITLLMQEKYGEESLFNQQSHWQAVYRILVDKGYCRDSDFDGFDVFILKVMPDKVNKPYRKDGAVQFFRG